VFTFFKLHFLQNGKIFKNGKKKRKITFVFLRRISALNIFFLLDLGLIIFIRLRLIKKIERLLNEVKNSVLSLK
jgi:hypothetical protein